MEYPYIDIKKTGNLLKKTIKEAGYNVKYVQNYLHFSCPQSVYRWFKGLAMPSLDNMYALSILLGRHIDELIVPNRPEFIELLEWTRNSSAERCFEYYYRLYTLGRQNEFQNRDDVENIRTEKGMK